MDPLSDKSLESLREVANVSKSKWAAVIAGILICVAACLGLSFAKNQSRGVGCAYLTCILVSMILQFAVVSIATGGTLSDISKINEVSDKYNINISIPISEQTSEDYQKLVSSEKDQLLSKTFRSWAKRWNNPSSKNENYDCKFESTALLADAEPATAADAEFMTAVRRLEETKDKCTPTERKVTCANMAMFGEKTTSYCQAKSGYESAFVTTCSDCVDKWWEMWHMAKYEDGQVPDLEAKWRGDSGVAYCRCMSRFFDTVTRHYPTIKNCGIAFGIIEMLLVASTIWLLMCGPDAPAVTDNDAPIELGQQPGGQSGPEMQLVTCPQDAGPGTMVMVQTADGRMMQAMVPPGVGPGMQFQIAV
eukprot:SRR837773.11828.p1 GENE.SRR837773.11828~~SRR837773.11828.p1  ORF type:complete len:401 (+),score=116.90 SRR837773.11828:116-1204(+)